MTILRNSGRVDIQIQDTCRTRKRRRGAAAGDSRRAERGPGRPLPPLRGSVGIFAFIALLEGCTAPPTNYGVGNDLAAHEGMLPLAPGLVITDATPPGILDANCYSEAASSCSVSWSNDIYPNMESTGAWQCASSSCHGGLTQPAINDGDPTGTYASLATYTGLSPGYVVPCNTNTSNCSILCNLTPSNGCGQKPMPIGTGTPLTTDQLAMIQTWIGCGSPPN